MKKLISIFLFCITLGLALQLMGCNPESVFSDRPFPSAGTSLERNDDDSINIVFSDGDANVMGDETTTVYIRNILSGNGFSHEVVQELVFTVPLDSLGEEFTLDETNASFTETASDMAFFPGAPTEDFTSTIAEGTVTVFYAYEGASLFNKDHGNGFFSFTFEDDEGNTRTLENGWFNF